MAGCQSNAIAGFKAQIYYSRDGGTTKQKLAEIREAEFTFEGDAIDVTSHDSEGFREFIAGLAQWGITSERLYTPDKGSQADLWGIMINKEVIDIYFRPKDMSGEDQFQGKAILINHSISSPNDDASLNNVEFQGCGKPTLTQIT